ncbi:MerR family transcriptional regulator [Kiloniella laminariae]|uniref:MerR family transcriptional regulator n=1 Tax=Kiloniella laminariae TaxID=454162 RepID=A0ABT4LGQ6_9PROT|nr:MerR family transcriptional regulator [Kiloniella laminariae]MCZ4280125.1 MerR family transcriptional regulator [Kiloniella laminariae]
MSTAETTTKSAAAFRTISEVSDDLDVPQHVLRFWETKFPQVKPLKRAGRRRYYRPEDLDVLRQIRDLLYRDGYTIKGVQKLFKDGNFKEEAPEVHSDSAQSKPAKIDNDLGTLLTSGLGTDEQRKLLMELKKIRSLLS